MVYEGVVKGAARSTAPPPHPPTNPIGPASTVATIPTQHSEPKLPPQQFHALLPDLSICFSSFVHTTCSLSRSRPYLALDGIYHPLGAAFPNNSTRPRRTGHRGFQATDGTLTLHGHRLPTDFDSARWLGHAPRPHTGVPRREHPFEDELFPLHSPLLGESWLVSFPPPSYMLKFSGYS